MILHLIRHPKPVVEPDICYGRLDLEAENAAAVAERLRAELPPDLPVWSSPLRRCRALAEYLHPAPLIDERLVEMDFGRWEGLRWDAVPRAELDSWAADVSGYAPPGGESLLLLQRRTLDFVASLPVPEAVVVTHAGVIRTLLAHWQGLPPERWASLQIGFGSLTRLFVNKRSTPQAG
jgi:alpha-ribazole phosphatase